MLLTPIADTYHDCFIAQQAYKKLKKTHTDSEETCKPDRERLQVPTLFFNLQNNNEIDETPTACQDPHVYTRLSRITKMKLHSANNSKACVLRAVKAPV